MSWPEFFSKLISDIVWPATLLFILCYFRTEIAKLFTRLTSLKYKDMEAEFSHNVEEGEQKILQVVTANSASESGPPQEVFHRDIDVPDALDKEEWYRRLAELSPTSAVISSWLDVEKELVEAARKLGFAEVPKSTFRLIRIMKSNEAIDKVTLWLVNHLRSMRNDIAHGQSTEPITTDLALRYRTLCVETIRLIKRCQDN